MNVAAPLGNLLRTWRSRRHLTQLDLALQAGISARHLSFLETGRAQPSRDMLSRLAEQLNIPRRERNELFAAAGLAPVFPERPLTDPTMAAARKAIDLIVSGHRPFPAFAIDRHWVLIASNGVLTPFLGSISPELLQAPVNSMRLTLHPEGLGSRLADYDEWRGHVLEKLRRQIAASADAVLIELYNEVKSYRTPIPPRARARPWAEHGGEPLVLPFRLVTDAGLLSFFTTTTVFGSPLDVTLEELSIELFYPADAETAGVLNEFTRSS
jgi:transcriptional regulator with XRE-family HTH domain